METLKKNIKSCGRLMTAKQRSLPDFFIAGTQKGGTTSLYSYLTQHPQIIGAFKKEVRYYESPVVRQKGIAWYRSHFPLEKQKRECDAITGEATPLMYSLHAPRLIYRDTPSLKLVFLLREPISRAFSHYKHNTRRENREHLSFGEAIRKELEMISEETRRSNEDEWYDDRKKRLYSYIYRGFYAQHLNRWQKYFPRSQMLVEESEFFYKEPQTCLDKITDFLGIDRYDFDCKKRLNVGEYSDEIGKFDYEYLNSIFQDENERLFCLLGRRLWGSNTSLLSS